MFSSSAIIILFLNKYVVPIPCVTCSSYLFVYLFYAVIIPLLIN